MRYFLFLLFHQLSVLTHAQTYRGIRLEDKKDYKNAVRLATSKGIELDLGHEKFASVVDTFLLNHKNTFLFIDHRPRRNDTLTISIGTYDTKSSNPQLQAVSQFIERSNLRYKVKNIKKWIPVIKQTDLYFIDTTLINTLDFDLQLKIKYDVVYSWKLYSKTDHSVIKEYVKPKINLSNSLDYQRLFDYVGSLHDGQDVDSLIVFISNQKGCKEEDRSALVIWKEDNEQKLTFFGGCYPQQEVKRDQRIDVNAVYKYMDKGDSLDFNYCGSFDSISRNGSTFILFSKAEVVQKIVVPAYYNIDENLPHPLLQLVRDLNQVFIDVKDENK